eukprot:TRINITY_DN2566_c0_g1_i1.p1 TRINITY_DN2566_c0_g1~~TRINITY_DN2566_c0_g1_i1.p1  ORF type:complete len:113 (+),score=25.19 TRINITY_DN2566_c0_g1_i1:241-579(+)
MEDPYCHIHETYEDIEEREAHTDISELDTHRAQVQMVQCPYDDQTLNTQFDPTTNFHSSHLHNQIRHSEDELLKKDERMLGLNESDLGNNDKIESISHRVPVKEVKWNYIKE